MKHVKIPDDVVLKDPATGAEVRTISFKEWMKSTVLVDEYWGKSAAKVIAAADLARRAGEANGTLTLGDEEYHDIKTVVDKPSAGYNVAVAVQIVSFINAVLHASAESPEKG